MNVACVVWMCPVVQVSILKNSNENAFQNVYDDFWDNVLMSSNQYHETSQLTKPIFMELTF